MNPLVPFALAVGAIIWVARALTRDDSKQRAKLESPRAFISFDFDHDRDQKVLFAGQCRKNSPTPFTAADWSSKTALPEDKWEAEISHKIGQCHIMFVLVSPTSYRATGVAKEIAMAQRHKVPFVGVYVSGAGDTTPLPKGLSRDRVYRWEWKTLAIAIEEMLKEGKNR